MNDEATETHSATAAAEVASSHDAEAAEPLSSEPQFGLADVVEAFTAMRHEWRGQSRDNRQLAEELQAAVQQIELLQETFAAPPSIPAAAADDTLAAKLVEALVEIDWHLSRAAEAALAFGGRQEQPPSLHAVITKAYESQGGFFRWLSRRYHQALLAAADKLLAEERGTASNPTAEGLQLVVSRVRRLLQDRQIERLDTVGKPFNAQQMNAVEAVDSDLQPSGHVIEQLSPAYLWQGRLIRYAEVRIAR